MIRIAFSAFNSSLVPLIEGLVPLIEGLVPLIEGL